MSDPRLSDAYRWCENLAHGHYENFPVASRLLPRRLRRPVAAIYAYARTADDLADEGDLEPETRLQRLDALAAAVEQMAEPPLSQDPLFMALGHTVAQHHLPLEPLLDLLSAFRQDVTRKRYENFGELMDYCRRSANPVGRLLLHLEHRTEPRNLGYSDAICSALQLINFLQDLGQDYAEHGRIYLPADEMARFGVEERDIAERRSTPALAALLRFQAQRAARMLRAGAPLGRVLSGRMGLELRMIVLGGERILSKLQARREDLFNRPRLNAGDRWHLLWGALRHGL